MATQMIDTALTGSEDLDVSSGDFALVESTPQHQRQLILNNKGDFKQNPTICVGAFDYMDDEGPADLVRAISIEFARDGMDVKGVSISGSGVINTDAFY